MMGVQGKQSLSITPLLQLPSPTLLVANCNPCPSFWQEHLAFKGTAQIGSLNPAYESKVLDLLDEGEARADRR